jgi:hypothetical protein
MTEFLTSAVSGQVTKFCSHIYATLVQILYTPTMSMVVDYRTACIVDVAQDRYRLIPLNQAQAQARAQANQAQAQAEVAPHQIAPTVVVG